MIWRKGHGKGTVTLKLGRRANGRERRDRRLPGGRWYGGCTRYYRRRKIAGRRKYRTTSGEKREVW